MRPDAIVQACEMLRGECVDALAAAERPVEQSAVVYQGYAAEYVGLFVYPSRFAAHNPLGVRKAIVDGKPYIPALETRVRILRDWPTGDDSWIAGEERPPALADRADAACGLLYDVAVIVARINTLASASGLSFAYSALGVGDSVPLIPSGGINGYEITVLVGLG